jgi:hypothetical protein
MTSPSFKILNDTIAAPYIHTQAAETPKERRARIVALADSLKRRRRRLPA